MKLEKNKFIPMLMITYLVIYYLWVNMWKETLPIGPHVANVLSMAGVMGALFWRVQLCYKNKSLLREHPTRYFWNALLIAQIVYFFSEVTWNYYQFVIGRVPYAGLPDYLYLSYYGVMALGLCVVLIKQNNNFDITKLEFNLLIMIIPVGIMAWTLLYNQIVLHLKELTNAEILISTGYIFSSPTLLCLVFGISNNSKQIIPKKTINLIMISLLILFVADMIYAFKSALNTNIPWGIISPIWPFASIIITYAFDVFVRSEKKCDITQNSKYKTSYSIVNQILPLLFAVMLVVFFVRAGSTNLIIPFDEKERILIVLLMFLLIALNQIRISIEREKALVELAELNDTLELKIFQRTEMLDHKNKQLKEILTEINHQAYHDVLTGLPNRKLFEERLQLSITQSQSTAILFIDLDRFKEINDSLGHSFGDKVLQAAAQLLNELIREKDLVARFGGDEFLVLLNDVNLKIITVVAKRILSAFNEPFKIEDQIVLITPSIGICRYPEEGNTIDELIKNADIAMYFAKEKGKNNFQFFASELNVNN